MKGKITKMGESDQPFGPTLKNMAIGIEAITPRMADLFLVFFQNNPVTNTARIPGLTIPVYS